jgi:glycosyltransferase involved in cell wall biosynthesis
VSDVSALLEQLQLPIHSQRVLYVGRIVEKKGLHDILNAFALIVAKRKNTYLLIAGDESQNPSYSTLLRQLAKDLGIEGSIRWLGFINEVQKPAIFAVADVFLHASYSEGMAMSILEAMGKGVAVVATKGCYMRAAADVKAIVECDQSFSDISTAVMRLLDDPNLRTKFIQSAFGYLDLNHSWDRIAVRMLSIYDDATNRNRATVTDSARADH